MALRQRKNGATARAIGAAHSDAPSLAVAVQGRLRADILAGRFDPGARLSPRALAGEFGVSLSVVREALSRLAEHGLVVAAPQLGFSVPPHDADDLRDLTKVRILIEGAALREAVQHADVEYEARVVAAHHRLARTPMFVGDAVSGAPVNDDWSAAHTAFHEALISAAPSPRLRELSAALRDRSELYRRWSGASLARRAECAVPEEHRLLMVAALDRDAERAVELLGTHFTLTTTCVIEEMRAAAPAVSEASA